MASSLKLCQHLAFMEYFYTIFRWNRYILSGIQILSPLNLWNSIYFDKIIKFYNIMNHFYGKYSVIKTKYENNNVS